MRSLGMKKNKTIGIVIDRGAIRFAPRSPKGFSTQGLFCMVSSTIAVNCST